MPTFTPLALLTAMVVGQPVTVEPLRPVIVAPVPPSSGIACLPRSVTRDTTVVALGMYGGRGAPTPFSIGGAGYALHTVKVTGRGQGKIVLVVAAYEPTVWDLSAVRGRVRAVVASGFYSQGITGLDTATPARFTSTAGPSGGVDPGCGQVPYGYGSTAEIERMAAAVRTAVGGQPRRYFGGYSPTSFDIDGGALVVPQPALAADVRAGAPISATGLLGSAPFGPDELGVTGELRAPTRIVEWDADGTLVRDQGGDPPSVRIHVDGPSPSDGFSDRRGRWRSGPAIAPSGWLILLAIAALWWWRRGRTGSDAQGADAVATTPSVWVVPPRTPPLQPVSPPMPRGSPSEEQDHADDHSDLAELAARTTSEPLVLALHRYGRARHALSHVALEADLEGEKAAILGRHFDHTTAHYRKVRASLYGAEADHADDTMRRAIDRMAARLTEIASEQRHRDMDGIDAAGRFIVARHPESTSEN